MKAVLDVHYGKETASVACVRFLEWGDSHPFRSRVCSLNVPSAYRPGRFFQRELPCLLHALNRESTRFETIVIDGYVHLKPPLEKGLGARLAEALPYPVIVIGVAKNPFRLADRFSKVFRAGSRRPLYVSSVNMAMDRAAALIRDMHGTYRIPTLLKITDQLCRSSRQGK